jgi:hypothetical protein
VATLQVHEALYFRLKIIDEFADVLNHLLIPNSCLVPANSTLLSQADLIGRFFINTQDHALQVNAFFNEHGDCHVSILLLSSVSLLQLDHFLLTLEELGVALLHILVDALQPLLVLLHALSQTIFSALLLLEHRVVVDLLDFLPLRIHLLLQVDD